jgi:hypothetical protein
MTTTFVWATPATVSGFGDDRTINLRMSPRAFLALGAALNIADEDALRDEGISEAVIKITDEMFDGIENALLLLFGPDWYSLATPKPANQLALRAILAMDDLEG